MATKYIHKFESTAQFLAHAPDNGVGAAIGEVSGVLYINIAGVAYRVQDGRSNTVTPTGAVTLTAAQSGSNIALNAAAGFAITLPPIVAGLNYRFMVGAAFATTNFTIVTPALADIINGSAIVNSVYLAAVAEDTISFVATAETIGDYVDVVADATQWLVSGVGALAGSITFTTAG